MFKNLPLWIFSPGIGLREKLRLAVLGEFEGIDIDIREAVELSEKYSPAYVKGMLDSFNLKAGAWELSFALDAEEKIYNDGLKDIEKYCLIAREVGVYTAKTVMKSAAFKERLNTVAGLLNDYGCRIAVKFPLFKDTSPVFKDNAGSIFDAWSWHVSGQGPETLRKTAHSFFYAEICDTNKDIGQTTGKRIYLPGETGVIDLKGILIALAEGGYKGPVSPGLPDRNILTLPSEMSVRLLGGAFTRVWKKAFTPV